MSTIYQWHGYDLGGYPAGVSNSDFTDDPEVDDAEDLTEVIKCEYCDEMLSFTVPENEDGLVQMDDEMAKLGWLYCRDGIQCGKHEIVYGGCA